jgi:hypothetical protein
MRQSSGMFFIGSRNRMLFLGLPVGLFMGGWATGSEIVAHGFSAAVMIGLIGGALCSAALVALIVTRWNKKWSAAERREARQAYARSHTTSVAFGLVGVGIVGAVAALLGAHGHNLGSALMAGIGIVIIVTTVLVTIIVVTHRGPLS